MEQFKIKILNQEKRWKQKKEKQEKGNQDKECQSQEKEEGVEIEQKNGVKKTANERNLRTIEEGKKEKRKGKNVFRTRQCKCNNCGYATNSSRKHKKNINKQFFTFF